MRLSLSSEGMVKYMVLTVLQAMKERVITAEYAGTIRKHETVVNLPFLNKTLDAFFQLSLAKHPEYVIEIDDQSTISNSETAITQMLNNGYLNYIVHRNVYLLNGLSLNNYYLATESNIQDYGVLCWGDSGLGATYQAFDQPPIPFDDGVTVTQYLTQFPRHRVAGNDVILSLAGADAISLLVTGWEPRLKTLVEDFRSYIPAPVNLF